MGWPPRPRTLREFHATRERRIVGTGPSPQGDLQAQHQQANGHEQAQAACVSADDGDAGGTPRHPQQQRERQQPPQQMPHHHDGFQQPGHSPHAQQGLEDDHRQGQHRHAGQVGIRPADCTEQQHQLGNDRQSRCRRMIPPHVHRNGDRNRQRRTDHLCPALRPLARGQQGQRQDQHPQQSRNHAVHLLTPRLARHHRANDRRGMVGHLRRRRRPRRLAVAGWPIRAAQARIGEAHKGTEHDHAGCQRHRQPSDAMEMPIQGFGRMHDVN